MSDPTKPTTTESSGSAGDAGQTGATPGRDTADMHGGEHAKMLDAAAEVALQLPENLRAVRDRLVEAFGDAEVLGFRGELTLIVAPAQILDVLRFCRDELDCELLADLSCVHWPGGTRTENAQETTGWPSYEFQTAGRIEIDYILLSLRHNHRFRVRTNIAEEQPRIASASGLYAVAGWMECEAYDFHGVVFEGHPELRRLHMPDDWVGHPLQKDYPLGGVDVQYKGALVPPPDTRKY